MIRRIPIPAAGKFNPRRFLISGSIYTNIITEYLNPCRKKDKVGMHKKTYFGFDSKETLSEVSSLGQKSRLYHIGYEFLLELQDSH